MKSSRLSHIHVMIYYPSWDTQLETSPRHIILQAITYSKYIYPFMYHFIGSLFTMDYDLCVSQ